MSLLLLNRPWAVSGKDERRPSIAFSTLVDRYEQTEDGFLIRTVHQPWIDLRGMLAKDPRFLHQVTPEQLEEIVAASYDRAGFVVTLTPRSGDRGRDVIAERPGLIRIRVIDQVKRFSPDHLVTANDVRALYGVLALDPAASKGYVTTTSDFAPGVSKEFAALVPTRLELRNGRALNKWLKDVDGSAL